jgi:hypothetical protein
MKMSKYQFEPYQKVLVRDHDSKNWRAAIFSYLDDTNCDYPYCCIGGRYAYCILFEGNEHLINTNTNPEPRFEPRKGQLVVVSDEPDRDWEIRKYADYYANRHWCVDPYQDVDNEDNQVSWLYCEPLKKHFDVETK